MEKGGASARRRTPSAASTPADHDPRQDLRTLLFALESVRDGDFSARLPSDWTGLEGKIADRFNEIVAANAEMASELARVGHVVGKQGKVRQRMRFARTRGAWGEMQVSFNTLIDDLVRPTTDVTAPSRPSRRGTCCRPSSSRSTAARSRASSAARR